MSMRSTAEPSSSCWRRSTESVTWPTWDWRSGTGRLRSRISASMTTPTRKIVKNVPTIASTSQRLDIDLHDPRHDEDAETHPQPAEDQQDVPHQGGEQGRDVVSVHDRDVQQDEERQGRQDRHRQESLRREHGDP